MLTFVLPPSLPLSSSPLPFCTSRSERIFHSAELISQQWAKRETITASLESRGNVLCVYVCVCFLTTSDLSKVTSKPTQASHPAKYYLFIIVIWLNVSKSLQPGSKIWWNVCPEKWAFKSEFCYSFRIACLTLTHGCLNVKPMYLYTYTLYTTF